MNINLGLTYDDEHKLNKQITALGGYNGSLKDEFSFMNPVYNCQVPEGTAVRANYASIPDLDGGGRVLYYFVRDAVLVRTGIVELHLELDPLMTYRDEINNLVCTVDRTADQNVTNAFMIDNEYQILACENIVTKTFPNALDDESMVLITVG